MSNDMFGNDLTKTDSFGTPRTTIAPTYKWANAHEWLGYHLSTINDPEKLRQIVRAFAISHDSDDIQDLFEKEMDKDGYFTPVKGRRK